MTTATIKYHGRRTGPAKVAEVWVLDDQGGHVLPLEPSLRLRQHSPTGFEWGYAGSGPSQLALALLLDATGDREAAENNYQRFKGEVVCGLPDAWVMDRQAVLDWVAALLPPPRPAMTAAEHNAFPRGRWS